MKYCSKYINSLMPNDAYMPQCNIPTLVQIMACRLFGTKPLSEPMLTYCQLGPEEHISVKFHLKFKSFHSRKTTWKCLSSAKWEPFCLGLNVLIKAFIITQLFPACTIVFPIVTVNKTGLPVPYYYQTWLNPFAVENWVNCMAAYGLAPCFVRSSTAIACTMLGNLGAVSIRKTVLPGMAIPMLKIRRPNGRLIFHMENAIRR